MEFKPGRYVSFIAFVGGSHERDWLASVWRDPGGAFEGEYRFRYYNGPGAWNEDDVKRFYSISFNDFEESKIKTVIQTTRSTCSNFSRRGLGRTSERKR